MTDRFRRRSIAAAAIFGTALLAACSSDDTSDDGEVATCDDSDAAVCLAEIGSLASDGALTLDRAVELDGGSSVELDAGSCGAGGHAPDRLVWKLCRLTLGDGRQVVVGRAAEPGLTVRARVGDVSVEFPLATTPGTAIVLTAPSQTFVIRDAEGTNVGSTMDA